MKNKNKPHPHDTRLHLMLWRYRKIKNLRAPSDKDLRRALLDEYKDEIKDLRRVLRETDDLARAKLPLCYKLGYMGNDRWSAWDFLSIRPHDKIRNLAELDAFFKCERHFFLHRKVMVSLSGGSDSDVMLDLIMRVLAARHNDYQCDVRFVFFDTGIEYAATKKHLDYLERKYNIEIERRRAITPVPNGCKKYGIPFLSKYASEMINRLQKHKFDFAGDGAKTFDELFAKYPQCKGALRWWCNINGDRSAYSISRFFMLKEFMIENPPDFLISPECCKGAKKDNAKQYERENNIDLNVLGLRKAEGGVRAVAIGTCFTEGVGYRVDTYRPIWWFNDKDKAQYEMTYKIVHSDCYKKYGLCRTGCAGCPFGSGFENELLIIQKREPKLYKAVCKIFGKSYDYTRKYREYAAKHKRGVSQNQMSIFDINNTEVATNDTRVEF